MSFGIGNRKKDDSRVLPLIEDTVNSQFTQLQNRFLEFIKDLDELEIYEKKLNKMTKEEYDSRKNEM